MTFTNFANLLLVQKKEHDALYYSRSKVVYVESKGWNFLPQCIKEHKCENTHIRYIRKE